MYIYTFKKNTNNGDIMNIIDSITKDNNFKDLIIKEIPFNNKKITILAIETITNSFNINEFILNNIKDLEKNDNIIEYLHYNLPCINIKSIKENEVLFHLVNAYTIIFVNNEYLAIETINTPERSITISEYEKSINGPKDSFTEHFNTNVGLIRKRIKSINLKLENVIIGKYSNTKVGIMYIDGITKLELKNKIREKIKKINIDGIIDSSYVKGYLSKSKSLFPTIKATERPDLVSQSLLEGKVIIIVDNSPDILILPSFFIDFFHMSDDYYQKSFNTTFIRIVRLLAFIIAIFLPSYYIAITTINVDFIPINMLINFIVGRNNVAIPAFVEAIIMILSFEILRESDMRIPSTQGTSVIVLGDAAVKAGIISPTMIIIVAISAIAGLVFQSMEIVNAIRIWRFILIILASVLGLYGIFIGIVLIITNICDTKSFDEDYLYPFSPININEQQDGFIKKNKKIKLRNPILSNNRIRGYK